jgi:anaerobic magnesium-protoporphyrin IX monomethyl ester cyclase
MKILVLNPPFLNRFSRSQRSPAVTKGGTTYYPYWLAYATGVLEQEAFDVKLVDAAAKNSTLTDILGIVRTFEPQLVVLDTSTPSIFNDLNVAEGIRKILPYAHIVLVGSHPSAVPEDTFGLSTCINSIARGDYSFKG